VCMISKAFPTSAQARAFASVGKPPISFTNSTDSNSHTSFTTSGRHVLMDNKGESCSSSRLVMSATQASQCCITGVKRRISSSSEIGSRFVRALSAPTSMTSAPALIAFVICCRISSIFRLPSPQKESSLTLTIPINKGRRGKRISRRCVLIETGGIFTTSFPHFFEGMGSSFVVKHPAHPIYPCEA